MGAPNAQTEASIELREQFSTPLSTAVVRCIVSIGAVGWCACA